MSVGEYARRLARDQMESRYLAEAKELRQDLDAANSELRKARKQFASAFEALLDYVGLPPEEAKKWVDDNLR